MNRPFILIKGAGEMATAVGHRLHRAGFPVAMTELPEPTCVRRLVSFAAAMFEGAITVEGVEARKVDRLDRFECSAPGAFIPVLPVDRLDLPALAPEIIVDARIAKTNLDNRVNDAPLVIGLGPGLYAGRDVHAVVETGRGHDLGRLILTGEAAPNTGVPGVIGGLTVERVLRAPADGRIDSAFAIGDHVEKGMTVAAVGGLPVVAGAAGVLRGLIRPGLRVTRGLKVGDIDPRGDATYCRTISDKARTISGAVLELVCAFTFTPH